MALMTKTRLTMAAHNCPGTLERLGRRLPASFADAVERYDADAVNDMLEEAVRRLLGTDSLSQGLEEYCRRFGIEEDLSHMDNVERILLIDRCRERIDRQLRDAWV